MAYIKTMKDANGNVVYPQTHVRAVYTADGETLETKLNNLPIKVSELENDAGFITSTVDNLTNYYKKTETYTQDEVKGLINAITTLNIEVVAEKPTENISTTTIYLIGTDTETDNDFEEWIYTNGNWELIGTTAIDLTPYATKEYVNTQFTENQADWNENDASAAAYIQNRTHYVNGVEEIEVFNYAFEAETGEVPSSNPFVFVHWSPDYKQNIEEGKTYKIRWDGTIYNCVPYIVGSRAYFGNLSLALMGEDTGEPFCIVGRGAE